MPTKPTTYTTPGLIIARAAMPELLKCDDTTRADCFEYLAQIVPDAEAEQLRIAAAAVRKSAEAQLLLAEVLTTA